MTDRRERLDLDVLQGLIELAEQVNGELPPYVTEHLGDHVRAAGVPGWRALAEHPAVLKRLDPIRLASAALHTQFGASPIPPLVAGIILSRSTLIDARPSDRAGLIEMGHARIQGSMTTKGERPRSSSGSWGVRRASLTPSTAHVVLPVGAGVRCVAAYREVSGALRLAIGSTDGAISLWDPVTGVVVGVLNGHTDAVRSCAVVPGYRTLLVSGSKDGTIRLWDLMSHVETARVHIAADTWSVVGLAESAVLSGAHDGSVRAWTIGEPASGGPALLETGGLPIPADALGAGGVDALLVHDDLVVVGRNQDRLEVWDRSALTHPTAIGARHVFSAAGAGVRALAAMSTPRGVRIFSGHVDQRVRVWEPQIEPSPRLLTEERISTRFLAVPVPTPERGELLLVGSQHDALLLDPKSGDVRGRLLGHTGDVRCGALVRGDDSLSIVTGSEDGTVRCWLSLSLSDARPRPPVTALSVARHADRDHPPVAISTPGEIWTIAEPEDLRFDVFASGRDVWFAHRGLRVEPPADYSHTHGAPVLALRASPNGRIVVSLDAAGTLIWWSFDAARELFLPSAPFDRDEHDPRRGAALEALTFLADTPQLLVARGPHLKIIAGDQHPFERRWELEPSPADVSALLSYPSWDGSTLIALAREVPGDSAGAEPAVLLIDIGAGTTTELLVHSRPVRALAVVQSLDGTRYLASGDGSGRLVLSDADKGYLVTVMETGIPILAIAGVEDGIMLGTSDGVVVLDVDALDPLRRQDGPMTSGPTSVRLRETYRGDDPPHPIARNAPEDFDPVPA